MKPTDVKSGTYIDFDIENIDKYPKLKDDDHVKISKYKNIFGKDQTLNWAEEIFVVIKIKSNVPYWGNCWNVLLKGAKDKSNRVLDLQSNKEKRW